MALNEKNIAMAVASGLSVVCATCEKYWTARDLGVPDNRCLAQEGCGSPIAGDVFHEYKGPMTRFDRWCFVCGQDASHAVRVASNVRVIGCCADHVDVIKNLKAEGKSAPRVVLISKGGEDLVEDSPSPAVFRVRS